MEHDSESLPCVWMSAGLLAYRLCDREYACDDCPLDAAMRGIAVSAPGVAPAEGAASAWRFPADRQYHHAHGWVLPLEHNRALVGLDVLAARLLAPAGSIVLPAVGSRIVAGGLVCWVKEESELIPLRSPVSGVVVDHNREVQEDPGLVLQSPYGDGWLFEVRCDTTTTDAGSLMGAQEAERRAADQLRHLRDQAMRVVGDSVGVGATLADGGELVTSLRGILGSARYAQLVTRILS